MGFEETSNTSVWRASGGTLKVHAVHCFSYTACMLLSYRVCLAALFSHPSVPFLLLHPFPHPHYMYAIFCLRCSIPYSRLTFSNSQMLFLHICPLTSMQGISSPNNHPCSFSFPLMISICRVFLSCLPWWHVFLCSWSTGYIHDEWMLIVFDILAAIIFTLCGGSITDVIQWY